MINASNKKIIAYKKIIVKLVVSNNKNNITTNYRNLALEKKNDISFST